MSVSTLPVLLWPVDDAQGTPWCLSGWCAIGKSQLFPLSTTEKTSWCSRIVLCHKLFLPCHQYIAITCYQRPRIAVAFTCIHINCFVSHSIVRLHLWEDVMCIFTWCILLYKQHFRLPLFFSLRECQSITLSLTLHPRFSPYLCQELWFSHEPHHPGEAIDSNQHCKTKEAETEQKYLLPTLYYINLP